MQALLSARDVTPHRYYNEQKVVESTAGQQLRDDLKRRERDFKTRQGEADTLESLYQVCVDAERG